MKKLENGYRVRVGGKGGSFGNGRLLGGGGSEELILKRVSGYKLWYGDFINCD